MALLYAGASVETVSRRLRHKDSNVTRAVYLHEIDDAERRAIERGLIDQHMTDALG